MELTHLACVLLLLGAVATLLLLTNATGYSVARILFFTKFSHLVPQFEFRDIVNHFKHSIFRSLLIL